MVNLESLAPLTTIDLSAVLNIFTQQKLFGNGAVVRAMAVFAEKDYDETRAERDEALSRTLRPDVFGDGALMLRWQTVAPGWTPA